MKYIHDMNNISCILMYTYIEKWVENIEYINVHRIRNFFHTAWKIVLYYH